MKRGDHTCINRSHQSDLPLRAEKNADGSINVPLVGDVIRCDDGTKYTITDASRYDKNYFADGPVGPLPTATCDWSRFDQPELPKVEVKRFNHPGGDYLFIRNLYETRRMLCSLYNAMGEDEWIMQCGSPRMRGDGTPRVHIHLTLPDDMISTPSGPGGRKWFPTCCTPAQAVTTTWKSGMCSKTADS